MPENPHPIVIADEICELLRDDPDAADWEQIRALLRQAEGSDDEIIDEVNRRGLLPQLLPERAQGNGEAFFSDVLACAREPAPLQTLSAEIIRRKGEQDGVFLEQLILHAERCQILPTLFANLIGAGAYEPLRSHLCRDGIKDSPSLRALARARPTYDAERVNATALRALRAPDFATDCPYELLIVPGYTPLSAARPMRLAELLPMRQRIELAARDFLSGQAPYIFVTGGSVHPAGTPHNEALMMRDYLMEQGVSPSRILVDPHARHTTTNLRNAGRLMLEHGLGRGLVVTGFDSPVFSQAFYLGNPDLSTFNLRCKRELGYAVGSLSEIDDNHISFSPDKACLSPSYFDPLDV